jgi:glutamate-ammonia-ligase adenylyltransferase
VVGLGKLGSREMTARSDLDVMTVYESADPTAMSQTKGWGAETFYGRFTQRLVAALSAPTAEGRLFEVDLQLRPSGTAGPVAVSLPALNRYYAEEAETWEALALTRARVVWASDETFAMEVARCFEAILRRPRNARTAAREVRAMRELMERERPPQGFWDMKLSPGGLVDVEFAAQLMQIVGASRGGPLVQSTAAALEALKAFGVATARESDCLVAAWRLQQNLSQTLKIALPEGADPDAEPGGLGRLLARAGGARDWPALRKKLQKTRRQARAAYETVLRSTKAGGSSP